MKSLILTVILGGTVTYVNAIEQSFVKPDKAPIDIKDRATVLRGAVHFKAQCLTCHSMKYMRFDEISQEAGIVPKLMPVWDEFAWGGNPPPDLSLVVKRRSADWVYTFLRSFYLDAGHSTGFNNLVWHNTKMPNPFVGIQGQQVLMVPLSDLQHIRGEKRWSELLELETQGAMTGEQFDDYVNDMVNYLAYASDPSSLEREKIGSWVIGYMVVLFIVLLALSLSYWDDIKRKHYQSSDK
jgi:ubiquinol-cytochrome c reductase cytochrome c1 subunit